MQRNNFAYNKRMHPLIHAQILIDHRLLLTFDLCLDGRRDSRRVDHGRMHAEFPCLRVRPKRRI